MTSFKDLERESRSETTWGELLDKYDNGMALITPLEVAFLFSLIKQMIFQKYRDDKTIERLEKDVQDIVHLRDALPRWHKIHDEAMALRKRVQYLETELRKYRITNENT